MATKSELIRSIPGALLFGLVAMIPLALAASASMAFLV